MTKPGYFYARFDEQWTVMKIRQVKEYEVSVGSQGKLSKPVCLNSSWCPFAF